MDHAAFQVHTEVLPSKDQLERAQNNMFRNLPAQGFGERVLAMHLQKDIAPALNKSSQSSRYYGFVTGGAAPAAVIADNLVTEYDQNVQVHLPKETIATDLEHVSSSMLCELIDLDPMDWPHRTFTTGATASNVVGLACGREHVIASRAKQRGKKASVAELGLVAAMKVAEIDTIQILTTVPHSSIRKAASIIGLGHASVKDVSSSSAAHKIDFAKLEEALHQDRTASIILISCSEVNTGLFATASLAECQKLRRLADDCGAWIHVDGAFGILARILPTLHGDWQSIRSGVEGMHLADSITGDCHKLLNVPYDCGFFLSKHLPTGTQVFQNPGAPYLSSSASQVPSPLNVGIENSRRFRALPVYANLIAYGKRGYQDMLLRQIHLARRIAEFVNAHDAYELLPKHTGVSEPFIIVLFRAKSASLNGRLVQHINNSREIYVSGTSWEGEPAARFAVSNWQANVERDFPVIQEVLQHVATL